MSDQNVTPQDIEIDGPLGVSWAANLLSSGAQERLTRDVMAAMRIETERIMAEDKRLWNLTRDRFGVEAVRGKSVSCDFITGKVILRPKPERA